MEQVPALSFDLIRSLDELYRVVLPHPSQDRGSELYLAGQRSVVDFLKQLLKESDETKLIT